VTSTQHRTIAVADCEIAFDNLTRKLYATDASLYQLEPAAVAFPRSAQQASSIIMASADAGVAITPRGAGSGLSGGAIGDGLIVEFSRYNRQISSTPFSSRTDFVSALTSPPARARPSAA
jgi:FAD/FMN-containing dehydrogenase